MTQHDNAPAPPLEEQPESQPPVSKIPGQLQNVKRLLPIGASVALLFGCGSTEVTTDSVEAGDEPASTSTLESSTTGTNSTNQPQDSAGGTDGPVTYAAEAISTEPEDALIEGTLVVADDCLYLDAEPGRIQVLWPFGTRWRAEPPAVLTSWDTTVRVGDMLLAGGGYYDVDQLSQWSQSPDVANRAAACAVNDARQVAVIQ